MGIEALEGDAVILRSILLVAAFSFATYVHAQDNSKAEKQPASPHVVVVVGAGGEDQYADMFQKWAGQWRSAIERAGAESGFIGAAPAADGQPTDRELLSQHLDDLAKQQPQSLWIVLIGHGTYDGRTARFNLEGPDISAEEFSELLQPMTCPVAVINCASSSSPFINTISGPGRVVLTATKSGSEANFARFGGALATVVEEGVADLDKDGQMSLLEAFLEASRRTATYYREEGRLASEHALIDDNGDARGTPAAWFEGFRVNPAKAKGGELDGQLARDFSLEAGDSVITLTPEQQARRKELEEQVELLRRNRPSPRDALYFSRLEELLVELAGIYEEAERAADSKESSTE